jgi:2-methylisocitrate lyase-like PEP mutase family enzyme
MSKEIDMATYAQKCAAFSALHAAPGTFVIPNPWDAGSARILTGFGFSALATTSAGLAFSLGGADASGIVTREAALANAKAICDATHLPVNGDLENLYRHAPAEAAEMIPLAAAAGLAGCSIEDSTGDPASPIYDFDMAVARVKAAVAAARALPHPFMLTARAENLLHGRKDLADTIRRLQAYEAAGADVLYAPGLADVPTIREVVSAVKKPVNVLVMPSSPHLTVADVAATGAKRISVGAAMARLAYGAFIEGAREIASAGTFSYGTRCMPSGEITKLMRS